MAFATTPQAHTTIPAGTPCAYCGEPAVAEDHLFPQRLAKKWGINPARAEQTVPACFKCNRELSDKPLVTFGQRLSLVRRHLWKRKLWSAA